MGSSDNAIHGAIRIATMYCRAYARIVHSVIKGEFPSLGAARTVVGGAAAPPRGRNCDRNSPHGAQGTRRIRLTRSFIKM